MPFAIILKLRPEATEDLQASLREAEIRAIWAHQISGALRSIHFHDGPGALLILDLQDRAAAEAAARDLPMVSGGAAVAEVLELKPFTGYAALFRPEVRT